MTYQQLIFLHEVLKAKSITKAADNLFISRQTISNSLNQLEEELGYPLLIRKKDGVELTPDGMLFHDRLIQVIESSGNLMQDMLEYGKTYRLPLHLGIIPCVDYAVHLGIDKWQREHPDINLIKEEIRGKESTERLLSGTLDVVITLMPSYPNPGYVSEILKEYKLYIAVHRDHPLASLPEIKEEDLRGYTMLSTTLGYQGLEYSGRKYMPYDDNSFKVKVSEEYYLLDAQLLNSEGFVFTYENSLESHIDCVKLIPLHGDYTYPIFIRTSTHTMKKTQYDRIIQDLKRFLQNWLSQ